MKGKFEGLLGAAVTQMNKNGYQLIGNGFNSDEVMWDIMSAASALQFQARFRHIAIVLISDI